ncbi:hypothetical protein Y1Q_0018050 [Alligator mississippiensis]|uniref:Uncharacterized protein n=1 Tax=Alligator mississippiensis TaxID=8496 RepID=A0A151MYC2_ALLMI|nr:hypothetical protein Y1Q_0018050 [Alligator mississippiensis]
MQQHFQADRIKVKSGSRFHEVFAQNDISWVGRTFPVPADDVILLVIPPPVRFSYPCTCYNFYSHVKTLFRKLVIQQFFTSLQYLPIMDQLLF